MTAPSKLAVADRAASQIGYREGSGNHNKFGVWYGWDHVPWCMQFISWCFAAAGGADGLAIIGGKSASTWATLQHFKKIGRFGHIPHPGSLVMYDWNGDGVSDHVEFVERVTSSGYMQVVGGNTSSGVRGSQSNGDGVYRRMRSSHYAVLGFCNPAYGSVPSPVVVSPSPIPSHLGDGGPRGRFPLPSSYWYGPFTRLTHNRSGFYAADRVAIKAIQREVRVGADGQYGPHTYAAVKAWQRHYHLSADGVVGPKTWAAMGKH